MAKFDNVLKRLGTKFKVDIEITFISKMGHKVWPGVMRADKKSQYVIIFLGAGVLNLKSSLKLVFCQG